MHPRIFPSSSSLHGFASLIVAIGLSWLVAGCQREDLSSVPGLVLSLKLPGSETMHTDTIIGRGASAYVRRCVVEITEAGTSRRIRHQSFLPDISSDGHFDVPIDLPDGDYDFRLWSDYVLADKPDADLFYLTDSLDWVEQCLPRPEGEVCFRDAAFGFISGVSCSDVPQQIQFDMERAVARYVILGENVAGYRSLSARIPSRYPLVETLHFEVVNMFFLPTAFCVSDGTVKNVSDGIVYDWSPSQLSDGGLTEDDQLIMASDVVLATEGPVSLSIAINVLGPDGERVGSISGIPVSVQRDCFTTVRGDFLELGTMLNLTFDTSWADTIIIYF